MNSEAELMAVNQEAEKPATLLDVFQEKEYPGRIDLWRIAVQIPEPPEMTPGGIVTPEEYRDAREFSTYVGMVRAMGPLCYKAITRSQLYLEDAHGCAVGDWVQFGKHDGEKFRTLDGTLWVILTDTQVICVTDEPEQFDCMSL
jgi:co-chaperonin GroES (HSP10)